MNARQPLRPGVHQPAKDAQGTITSLRRALISLGFLGLAGLAAELAAVGHWYGPGQLVPFIVLALGLAAIILYLITDQSRTRLLLRSTSLLLVVTGLFGTVEHLSKNPDLLAAGRQESAMPANAAPGQSGLFGLPAPRSNWLNGAAPVSAPLAMSGLGMLLLLALYRREHDRPLVAAPTTRTEQSRQSSFER